MPDDDTPQFRTTRLPDAEFEEKVMKAFNSRPWWRRCRIPVPASWIEWISDFIRSTFCVLAMGVCILAGIRDYGLSSLSPLMITVFVLIALFIFAYHLDEIREKRLRTTGKIVLMGSLAFLIGLVLAVVTVYFVWSTF